MFRHFALVNPRRYEVFGYVLAVYLLAWGLGAGARYFVPLSSRLLFALLAVSLAVAWLYLVVGGRTLNIFDWSHGRIVPLLLFFLPAFISGWLFSAVHAEVQVLSAFNLATLYSASLAGTFLGGVVTGSVAPAVSSFLYGIPIGLAVLTALHFATYRNLISGIVVVAVFVEVTLLIWKTIDPVLVYYRSSQYAPELTDIREDWASSVWVRGTVEKHFVVNGRAETPDFEHKYGGTRRLQVETILAAKHHSDILLIGLGLGVSGGDLAAKLPESHITAVDYSPAVLDFVRRYGGYNSNIATRKNVSIIIADGRMVVQTHQRKYDIVMEMASGEGTPGVSTIKSIEFIEMVKNHLKPGDFYVANVGLDGPSVCAIRAAQSVFRNVYFHLGFLAASDEPLESLLDLNALMDYRAKFGMMFGPPLKYPEAVVRIAPLGQGRATQDMDPCSDFPTRGAWHQGDLDRQVMLWPSSDVLSSPARHP